MNPDNLTFRLGESYLLKLVDGSVHVAIYQMSPSGCVPLFKLFDGSWVSPLYVEIIDESGDED